MSTVVHGVAAGESDGDTTGEANRPSAAQAKLAASMKDQETRRGDSAD